MITNKLLADTIHIQDIDIAIHKENERMIIGNFSAPSTWSGWGRIVHGGFQGILLDEILSFASKFLTNKDTCARKEIIINYKKPVYVEQPLIISACLLEDNVYDHQIKLSGEIKDTERNLLTRSEVNLTFEPEENESILSNKTDWFTHENVETIRKWPSWSACCTSPLEHLWNINIDWRIDPKKMTLAAFSNISDGLKQKNNSNAGMMIALFDHAMGALGRIQENGILITKQIKTTLYQSQSISGDILLITQGYQWLDNPYQTKGWILHNNSLVAKADGVFKVLT